MNKHIGFFNSHQKDKVKHEEADIAELLRIMNHYKQFKLGDYLIAKSDSDKSDIQCTRDGVPLKFIVVLIDKNGFPWFKRLNASNKTFGDLYFSLDSDHGIRWEIDPDYIEAIIAGRESEYNPVDRIATYNSARNAIIDYNNTSHVIKEVNAREKFFNGLAIGSVFYRSTNRWLVVTDRKVVDAHTIAKKLDKLSGLEQMRIKQLTVGTVTILGLQNENGVRSSINCLSDTYNKLYSRQPKSYKPLKSL